MAATATGAENIVRFPESKDVVPVSTWVLISNFKIMYNLLRRPDGSFDRLLAEFLDPKVPANAAPIDGAATWDVFIDRPSGLWGRLFWPTNRAGGARLMPLVIYFHGGSFVHSSANSTIYDAMCRRLVKMCGIVILLVNFRRAPEDRYPAAYEDGLMSVRWSINAFGKHVLGSLGCCPSKCFLAGDSSGGNIAHNVMVRATREGIVLSGIVLLMPMFGGQQRTLAELTLDGKYFVTLNDRDWYWRAFLPADADRTHPACNPFSPMAPSLADIDLPPCLVVVGGLEMLHDWQLIYVDSMRQAGKSVEVMFLDQATMGFFLLADSELFYTLVEGLQRFFRQA